MTHSAVGYSSAHKAAHRGGVSGADGEGCLWRQGAIALELDRRREEEDRGEAGDAAAARGGDMLLTVKIDCSLIEDQGSGKLLLEGFVRPSQPPY